MQTAPSAGQQGTYSLPSEYLPPSTITTPDDRTFPPLEMLAETWREEEPRTVTDTEVGTPGRTVEGATSR